MQCDNGPATTLGVAGASYVKTNNTYVMATVSEPNAIALFNMVNVAWYKNGPVALTSAVACVASWPIARGGHVDVSSKAYGVKQKSCKATDS